MKLNIKNSQLIVIALVVLAVLSRCLPHPPNVVPITAISLLSAVYLKRRVALFVPIVCMLISDAIIGFYGSVMFFVYGSFLLTTGLGFLIQKKPSIVNIACVTLLSSLLFFVITNFGVWLVGTMYTKDLSGLLSSYIAGIPFFRNTLIGDIFYTTILFSLYSLLNSKNFSFNLFSPKIRKDYALKQS